MSSSSSSGTPPPIRIRATRGLGRHCSRLAAGGASSTPRKDPSVVGSRLMFLHGPNGRAHHAGLMGSYMASLFESVKSIYGKLVVVIKLIFSLFKNEGYIEAPVNESLLRSFDLENGNGKSFYAKLFPGLRLDCYRVLVHWVAEYSCEAGELLDGILPFEGPIVAVDLAYLLSGVILKYDLKNMMLPGVYEVSVLGAKFLHFDEEICVPVRQLIVELMEFDGYVGAGGLDPMHMISTAAAVGAATIASNQASTMFRNQLDHMVEVNTMLTEEEEEWLKRDRSQIYFSKTHEVPHDHPYLAACREVIRYDFDKLFNLRTTNFSTLILGAGTREYRKYNSNVNLSFQFAGLEGKDAERIVVDCLNSVKSLKMKKIKKLKTKEAAIENAERLKTVSDMMTEFKQTRKIPDRIILWEDTKDMLAGKLNKNFSVLVFQDVGYNFSSNDWGNIFKHTGAFIAYGYMCLPWELIYPDIVCPPGYVYRAKGDTSYMGYHGYSNGYVHKTNEWKTLMDGCLMKCGSFNIGIEFLSRVGPMTLIRLFRCETEEYVTRHLELPEHLKTVSILDVHESYDRIRTELNIDKLVYFPVRAEEFNEAVNYGLDIAKDSLNFSNILLYIRRRTSGVSLVTKNVSKTWTVRTSKIAPFSMVVYLYVRFLTQEYLNIQNHVEDATFTVAGQFLFSYGKKIRSNIKEFFDLFRRHDMFPLLVKNVDHDVWQESNSKISWFRKKNTLLDVSPGDDPLMENRFSIKEDEEDKDETTCSFCEELKEVTGEQIFTCQRNKVEEAFHTFALSSSELNKLRTTLNDTTKDPIGLKSVKETAARFVPLSTFEHRIRVKYLCGPPGTGKSYIIRSLGNSECLVLVPFARLKTDYTNFTHPITKKRASLKVSTQHAAFTALNHQRIFVDEYTAMPYEYLAVIAYNCGADEVIFVGDHRQTTLINEVEGISIDSKVKMSEIRSHELIKNFRNPSDAVNVLNRSYGYTMLATNNRIGFKFDEPQNFDKYPNHTPLFFTNATARSFGMSNDTGDRVTVRANQGATYQNVKLVVTGADVNLYSMSSMGIVALSRHTDECVILIEAGTGAVTFGATISTSMRRVIKVSPLNISPVFQREEQIRLLEVIDPDMPALIDVDVEIEAPEEEDQPENQNTGNDEDDDEDGKKKRKKKPDTEGCKDDKKDDDDDDDGNDDNNDGRRRSLFAKIINALITILSVWFPVLDRIRVAYYMQDRQLREQSFEGPKGEKLVIAATGREYTLPKMGEPQIRYDGRQERAIKPREIESQELPSVQEVEVIEKENTVMILDDTSTKTQVEVEREQPNAKLASEVDNEDSSQGIVSGEITQQAQENEDIQIPIQQVDVDFAKPPTDNSCMLECIAKVTVNSVDDVWKSMRLALGEKRVAETYNKPLSTDELNIFCALNRMSLVVISDFSTVTCGLISTNSGAIHHSSEKSGHFYMPKIFTRKQRTLVTKMDDIISLNNSAVTSFVPTHWDVIFYYVDNNFSRFSQTEKLKLTREISGSFYVNPLVAGSIDKLIGFTKPIQNMTVKEIKMILEKAPLTWRQLTTFMLMIRLTRNKRYWNDLKSHLINLQPYTEKLVGSTKEEITSLAKVGVHMLKEAPPNPFQNIDKGFEEMARLFAKPVFLKNWLVEGEVDYEFQHVPLEQSPYDCFKMLVEEFSTCNEKDFALSNQESIGYVEKEFGNGTFDSTTLDYLNQRKNPKSSVEKSWCLLNVAPGVSYYKNNLSQSIHCLQARYLTRAYVSVFSTKSVDKAREIADMFYDEHMMENYDIFNEQDVDITVYESEHAMVLKNYDKQTTFDMHTDTSVRFSMKDIFKPFKTKVDLFKAGQGISAWSKDMQTIFQTAFRLINKHFINCLKPHVVYDNGIDEYELMSRINLLFACLPSVSINGVIDATACDSGQNLFTQQIERRILERMGIEENFLNWYYQQRESYILKGYGVIAKIKEIKTSGEPATLLNNTILMACLMNYIIRGEGPCVLVIKGDDGLKRQANMCYRSDVVEDLKNFLKMKFKVDIDIPITFCGYFLAGSNLFPDLVRKSFKIVGHKFRDYEHFCEYQQSLRDWVLVVNKLGLSRIVEITSDNYGFRREYCYNLFYSIVSLTHIGRKQFVKIFKLRAINLKEDFISTEPWSETLPWYRGSN